MSLQEIRHSVSKTEEHILSPYSWHFTIEQLLTCSPSRHHCTHPLSAGCYGLHWAAVPQYWSEHIPSRNLQLAGELLWAKWHSTSESAGQAANKKKKKKKLQRITCLAGNHFIPTSLLGYICRNLLWFGQRFSESVAQSPCPAFCQPHQAQGTCIYGGWSFLPPGSQWVCLEWQCRSPHL